MATNTLKTLSDGDITREALRILKNANSTLKAVNRQYDDRFAKEGAKNGGTLQIRLPSKPPHWWLARRSTSAWASSLRS
jgi:hypothetical protein